MAEQITEIREATDWQSRLSEYGHTRFDGFEVVTSERTVRMGISNDQDCCEQTGYFWSEDNVSEFIGAELLKVEIVGTELNVKKHVDVDDGGTMFVNFETSRGTLQFVVYNTHNGYYGHQAVVESDGLAHTERL